VKDATKGLWVTGVLLAVEGIEVFGIWDFNEVQEDYITRTSAFLGLLWIFFTRRKVV
jgi:hypothetical protein